MSTAEGKKNFTAQYMKEVLNHAEINCSIAVNKNGKVNSKTSGFNVNVKKELKEYLTHKLVDYESFSFKVITKINNDQPLELNNAEFTRHGKYGYITVSNSKNGKNEKLIITVELSLFKKILIADEDIKPKEIIKSSQLTVKLYDVASLKGTPAESFDVIEGYRAKTFIRKGEVILKESVEKQPDVNLGQNVIAFLIKGNVEINFLAFARQEGYIGDIIRIRTSDNKYFSAKIYDKNKVLIVE
ncbi:flagellar basal body P-ring formation chaperone FlgA [Melioribacteraceae bacterium 4301-Me]|uniref:flagellar basal body P-ring formation chaperone FlgA n=1 Tax=Pyranulibacter aquaticus TaxID=3163344 RepID=UPI003594D863